MRIPKRYGQSRVESCPFCNKQGVTKNKQGIPVCLKHKESILDDIKCVCGSFLEVKSGKYGAYFNCLNCGNINFKKAMEIGVAKEKEVVNENKNVEPVVRRKKEIVREKRETFVTSDELDFI
jgi:transcription elongation factor Elf1